VPGTPSLPNEQNGALTSIGSVNLPQTNEFGVAIDASGGFVYLTQASNVLEYAVQADGALSAIGSFMPTSNARSSLGHIVTTRPTSKTECAYAFDDGLQEVWEMSIDTTNGSLSLVGSEPVNATESDETALNLPELRTDPNGKFIYVTSGEPGTIFVLSPESISKEAPNSCAMALTSQLTVDANGTVDIAVEPTGYFAYITDSQQLPATVPATVLEASINQTTGALTPITRVNAESPTNLNSEPYFPVTTH
jgi:DNA-binding beta-propeller fold protein YncE